MTDFALFLGILMGGSVGVGLAFLIFGSLLNRSNNHGDYVGENSKYTGGIGYSAQIDKSLHKQDAQSAFLNTYYKPLYPDPVFKNQSARVIRKMPAPQAPAVQAAPATPATAVAAAAAATGFPSSTAFPTAPAAQAVQAAQVATVQAAQAAQNYQAVPAAPAAPMGYQSAPAAQGYPTAPVGYQAPAAPTQQDYENYQHLSD